MNDPAETAELLALLRTIEAKSLTRAAAELGLPRATIGRRIARLERKLGTRLLRRTTRSVALTSAGEVFARHARIVLEALSDAQSSVRQQDGVVRGEVRVSLPPVMDESLAVMLAKFSKKYPDVRVHVDFSARIVDLRTDGYDVALRASRSIDQGLVARVVGRHKVIAVASPTYLAEMGTPKTAKDLRRHRCVTGFSSSAFGDPVHSTWPAGKGVVHVEGTFSCSNDIVLRRDAALHGLGISLVPDILLGEHLASGALVQVLAGIVEAESTLAVVYLERAFVAPHVRVFIEALVAWAPKALRPIARSMPSRKRDRSSRARESPQPRRDRGSA